MRKDQDRKMRDGLRNESGTEKNFMREHNDQEWAIVPTILYIISYIVSYIIYHIISYHIRSDQIISYHIISYHINHIIHAYRDSLEFLT